jgi:GT2 family glycosyltransferase
VSTAIATVLSSSFGMGNSYFRIGSKEIRQTDTVPFGCFHKSLFEKIGYFDEELIRNQDDEFNGRIIKNGGKIFLIPFVEVNYYGRDTLRKTSKMFYQYGLFKPLVNKKLGTPATLRQFVPPLFVATLILTPILLWILPSLGILFSSLIALYLLLNFGISFCEAIRLKRFSVFLLLPVTFFIVHVSYGWGYLTGMVKILRKQPFAVQINR